MGFSHFALPLLVKSEYSPTYSATFCSITEWQSVMSVSKEMENWSAKSVGKMGLVRKYYSAYRTEFVGNRKSLPSIGYRLSGVGR